MLCRSSKRSGVSSIIGSIFFILIMVVGITSLVSIFNSFMAYNTQVNKAGNAQVQAQSTSLSISGSSFGAFPPSTTSNFNVATTGCTTTSTLPTNQEGLFYAAGMWWDFFTCNSSFLYSTSFDGVTWEPATAIPNLVSGYTVGPYFSIEVEGSTIYLVIASHATLRFQFGIGTLASGGTGSAPAGTITWTSPPAEVVTGAQPTGPIQIEVDGSGNEWVAVVQGTCSTATNCQIQIYERLGSCSSGAPANYGWEPNSCSSSTAPTNYAPTSPALNALAPNANMILLAPPSTLSPIGAILTYETAGTAVPAGQTGTISVITQATLGGTPGSGWVAMTLTGITDYSLTSSSALFIGNTMDFAGLQNAGTGQTTGALKFWTLPFTSMSAATASAEQTIEGGTARAWMAALEASGTTLALFDAYPTAGTIQYYTSSNLGSTGLWSSAITLESAETNVNNLSPAAGGLAVTWANSVPNIRFAALSTFTITNNSPFGVHVVDLYVYNPATNSLAAHYYVNSTEDFDYWVGQGSTMALPIRFIWAAATSYLVTIGTDTGLTTQLTATAPPGATVVCPAGTFVSQTAPTTMCAGVVPAPSPAVPAYASNANTCNVASTSTSAGFTSPISYTTSLQSSGNLYLGMTFNVASPATSGLTSKWQFAFGTGSAPACAATSGLGTTVGAQYTIQTQAGAAGSWGQSIGMVLTGLTPNTAYWFDVQVTDSSGGIWVYSNQGVSISEALSATNVFPNVAETDNPNTCTHTNTATTLMGGLGVTYKTLPSGIGSGNLRITLSFNLQSPATLAVTNKWQIAYGSTATPNCNDASTGTTVGKQYTVESEAAVVMQLEQSESVVITGLTAATTYWFDVQSTDSSTNQWITSLPTLAVSEEAGLNGVNIPANIVYPPSAQTAGCVTTAAATSMAGLKEFYTLTSNSKGALYGTMTVNVLASGTIATGSTSAWKLAYADVTANTVPACAAAAVGTVVGQSYTAKTVTTTAFSEAQTEQFVITGLLAGHTYWFDLQVTNTGASFTSTYSVPTLSITDFQPTNIPHDNTIFLTGNAPSCTITTSGSARMGGMAVIPTTANPPMEYQTTSYGTGNIKITLAMLITTAAASGSTYSYRVAYGTVTDGTANPACTVAATGTPVGNSYTYTHLSNTIQGTPQASVTVEISGLSHGTTYWFDFQSTYSVTTGANSLPQIQVIEPA